MIVMTSAEIDELRHALSVTELSQLADQVQALEALDVIADCEGDLGDAAIVLALRAQQLPEEEGEEWLASLAKRCRPLLCEAAVQESLQAKQWLLAFERVLASQWVPPLLVLPVVVYAVKVGLDQFCPTDA
ncbi:hypothetical protein OOK60_04650 [Trichothermofontia sichuanensis B231]|uniref:hypothetical protein n=1 Tax=Trichothermofontia sichuanensis TaxID=3045816 RepID=UPI0022486C58|nr:hypothetical protein [Trichothermofontia sichuanensis]UZQ55368.1 hypothetical protein OOK60_04650 [Trichothermofontia sichuanensis B231]